MDQLPPIQETTQKQYQIMPYNEYEQRYYPMQQSGATTFASNPLHSNQYQYQNMYSQNQNQAYTQGMAQGTAQGTAQEMAWKNQAVSQLHQQSQSQSQPQPNPNRKPFQPYVYHQTVNISQQFSTQQYMNQEYSNLRAVADEIPNYTEQSPRNDKESINFKGTTTKPIIPKISQESHIVENDANSECCSSCSSGSLCSESDCDGRDVVVPCTSPECEQPVCTSPECEQPVYPEPCNKEAALSRRCSVVGDNFPSDRMFPSWDNSAWIPTVSRAEQQQASTFQPLAPGLQNNQSPQQISPSPVQQPHHWP
ncbi:hypothetical protein DID88_003517 [Monilinia fructigena]|uniref:Uncharacterized protein n=1 Tax=Monilinia fructigena TaxID=38457 RepID=A0A395IVI5_9HELO|nr:hypothetical protein DID88_003517 [Monilinia fructigena]